VILIFTLPPLRGLTGVRIRTKRREVKDMTKEKAKKLYKHLEDRRILSEFLDKEAKKIILEALENFDKGAPVINSLRDPIDYFGKAWIVVTVCKEDLANYFTPKELKCLTDGDMGKIASKIGDAVLDCGYWDIVSGVTDWWKETN
jgi:hypothetical protein